MFNLKCICNYYIYYEMHRRYAVIRQNTEWPEAPNTHFVEADYTFTIK